MHTFIDLCWLIKFYFPEPNSLEKKLLHKSRKRKALRVSLVAHLEEKEIRPW